MFPLDGHCQERFKGTGTTLPFRSTGSRLGKEFRPMNASEAIERLREVIRRQQKVLVPEDGQVHWLLL